MIDGIRPYQVTAGVLTVLALYAVARSRRRGRDRRHRLLIGFSVICADILLLRLVPPKGSGFIALQWLLGGASVVLAAMAGAGRQDDRNHWLDRSRSRNYGLYVGGTCLLIALFLLFDLRGFAGSLLTWESPVSRSYAELFRAGEGVATFALGRLRWDDGVLSAGQTSLFYGAPTYAILTWFGFNPTNLRIGSIVLALVSVWLLYRAGTRFFGPFVGAAGSIMLALNPAFLYYARYGSSIAGTLCAALIACYATWSFLEDSQPAAWKAPLALLALYLATLNYATARLFVIALLVTVMSVPVLRRNRLTDRRTIGVVIIVFGFLGIVMIERWYGADSSLLNARGEQVFNFLQAPDYIAQYLGRPVPVDRLSASDKAALLARVVVQTVPQYVGFLSPYTRIDPEGRGVVWIGDPPNLRLYDAALFPFICLGFVISLRRYRSWPAWSLALCFILVSLSLLLTTRVDTHRMMLLVIPLSLWAAIGMQTAYEGLAPAQTRRGFAHTIAVVLIASAALSGLRFVFMVTPLPSICGALVDVVETIPEPAAAGGRIDHRDLSWVNLRLIERSRNAGGASFRLLPDSVAETLSDESSADRGAAGDALAKLEQELARSTIVLTPGHKFTDLRKRLVDAGHGVRTETRRSFEFLIIERRRSTAAARLPVNANESDAASFVARRFPRAPSR
jgi:hypothetical protein